MLDRIETWLFYSPDCLEHQLIAGVALISFGFIVGLAMSGTEIKSVMEML